MKELYNQVCKCAIKEVIQFEEEKNVLKKERPGQDVIMNDDPVDKGTNKSSSKNDDDFYLYS